MTFPSVLRLLESAGQAMTAAEIKQAMVATGLSKDDVDRAWAGIQKRLKAHERIVMQGKAYRWVSPAEAVDLLVKGDVEGARLSALAEAIRSALHTPPLFDPESAARQRQDQIDAVRQLAELAGEVEELLANETEPEVMIRQLRAWIKRSGLDPVGRAGEQTTFDRKVHKPIDGPIRDGAKVFVVRPGYVWKAADHEVLLGKAIVEE